MNTFTVADLPENKFFEKDALLDKKFIVCPVGVPITTLLKKSLKEWGFATVFTEGGIVENSPLFTAEDMEMQGMPARDSDELDALTEEAEPGWQSAEEGAKKRQRADTAQDKELDAVKEEYDGYLEYAESVYEKFTRIQSLDTKEITDKMKDFCTFIRRNRSHVLRLQAEGSKGGGKTYLAEHSLRSTVFAVAIALQLNLPMHRMIELAVSCFLHEIGMTRLPQKFFASSSPLSGQEKKAITVHPVISYNILSEASFPLNICLGALEHHEREDGTGYPRRLTKEQISIYAKIIAVACSYEAATSKRPFKEEMDAYSGIIDILKNNGHQYDPTIVHALLFSLSIYPIGSYVLLSDGRRGQVVDINPQDPKCPIVQIRGEYKGDGTPKIIETNEYAVYVLRPLTKEEAAAFKS